MANKVYKMIVPKPGAANKDGNEVRLYAHDEVIEAKEDWQGEVMETFVANGFAMEVKMDSVEQTADIESDVEPKRARNEKGQLVGDDPDTPEINEAWEGGKAPAKKKTTKKKATTKKSTKKKA